MLDSVFNEVVSLKVCKFIKKRLKHRSIPLNVANVLRTPFSQNISGRLLLLLQNRTLQTILSTKMIIYCKQYKNDTLFRTTITGLKYQGIKRDGKLSLDLHFLENAKLMKAIVIGSFIQSR